MEEFRFVYEGDREHLEAFRTELEGSFQHALVHWSVMERAQTGSILEQSPLNHGEIVEVLGTISVSLAAAGSYDGVKAAVRKVAEKYKVREQKPNEMEGGKATADGNSGDADKSE